jgi:phosphate transport system protein
MLKELLSVFRKGDPLEAMGENFGEMIRLTRDLTTTAGNFCFGEPATSEDRTGVFKQDVKVNQLERVIRKQVAAHLSLQSMASNVPYCLLLMSLVKDVERIGDYAKNLVEVRDIHPEALPEGEFLNELKAIRQGVEGTFQDTAKAFKGSDRDLAVELIRTGRDITQRCDVLIQRIARGPQDSSATTALVLATRYYKRIGAHLLNVLSSVVMPLHKLDYYDEKELPGLREESDEN